MCSHGDEPDRPVPGTNTPTDLQDRVRGALVGVAVGDALGAAFEGHPGPVPSQHLHNHLQGDQALRYTDDSAMTIAVAESLLFCDGLDEDHLAGTFTVRFERDPDRGYGAGTAQLLTELGAGGVWRQLAPARFAGAGSFGNGAAMRAAPFGVWAANPDEASAVARAAATITHTHPHAVDGAGLLAAAVSWALHGDAENTEELLPSLLDVAASGDFRTRLELADEISAAPADLVAETLGTGVAALDAICSFLHHPGSFEEAVRFAISLGGDTDTIAAMTGAVSGALLGERAIPPRWRQRCEGPAELRELADRIAVRRYR